MQKILNQTVRYAAIVVLSTTAHFAQADVTSDTATINTFYDLLSNGVTDKAEMKTLASGVVAEKWQNYNGLQGLDGFATTFTSYHQVMPDMKWKVQDIIHAGHRYIVRSIGEGTPVADFLGLGSAWVPGARFSMMTIDIHTIGKNGKIVKSYHVEDWRTAMKQLKTAPTP